ncbi:MAG: M13 family metallopeptidase [Terriglobales bacterium]
MHKGTVPASLALTAALVLGACSKSKPTPAAASKELSGVATADLDTHISPCQDFYHYACGNWLAHNPIPADEPEWGTFDVLARHNQEVLRTILQRASANLGAERDAASRGVGREVGIYYQACMNESAIQAAGEKPLAPELAAIDGISTPAQLAAEVARLQLAGADVLFNFGPTQDAKHASANEMGDADQGGLGLPDRGYYLRAGARAEALRKSYTAHVQQMFVLLGDTDATAMAEASTVMRIETTLAQASMTNVERRNPDATYHKTTLRRFEALTPAFAWSSYFQALGAPAFTTVNVDVPGFFRALNRQLHAVPLRDWKTYLRWHLVHSAAPALSTPFVNTNFAFYGTTLEGLKAQPPRWKKCVISTDEHLGEALGQLYVQVAFSPQAKAHMTAMVENLEAALGRDIEGLDWMTPATKKQAMLKLRAITNKIGYPDHWIDYSSIPLSADQYFADWKNANIFESRRQLNKIGKPADRSLWSMTPPTVNAYYQPDWNEIVFPAGILQPPFFSDTRDDAVNYGAIGAVMGHEMTHGFDDEGRKFDAQGNLKDWWTPADAKAFQERAACLVKEYDGFSPSAGVHENGRLTLGENTADNGGIRVAYMAMEAALAGTPDTKKGGFTREQRFFLGYGQIWCENDRPQWARLMANTDPHAAAEFRVNGVVSNTPEFAAAFHCGPGDPMTAGPKACRVW